MKRLLLLALLLGACMQRSPYHKPVIRTIKVTDFYGNPIPNGYCRYFYQRCESCDWVEFDDVCGKYEIGDTLITKKDSK